MFDWLLSASAAGFGAFFGAIGAYFLARRKESERRNNEYLCLLLIIYEHLDVLYKLLAAIPDKTIKQVDGVKVVDFDLPFPELDISIEQMQSLMELAPDKQMPAALIKLQHFLKTHSRRVTKYGSIVLPVELIQQQVRQLQIMLLSVRVQYEQAANDVFPVEESAHK